MKVFHCGLLTSVIITFYNIIQSTSLEHFQFCVNDREKRVECSPGTVIAINEDSVKLCHKNECGQKQNGHNAQSGMTLWEKCHGKEECTLSEEDVDTSLCSYEVNALDFTYSCVNLSSSHGANLLLGGSIDREIGPNEKIQVRSQNYPLQVEKRKVPMTYTCEFTKIGGMLENELFLRLQRISLAENSYLGIDIDWYRHLSLVGKGDVALNGQDNCQPAAFSEKVVMYYRTCARAFEDETMQGSMWITMRTNTALHVKCYTTKTMTRTCSFGFNVNGCIARKLDFSSYNGSACNCSGDHYYPEPEDDTFA